MARDVRGERHQLSAVREAEAALRPVLAEQLREAVTGDDALASRLRAWADAADLRTGVRGDDDGGAGTAIGRAAARQASVLTNHLRYRVVVGRRPPAGIAETPVAPFRALDRPPAVDATLDSLAAELADGTADLIGARYADALSDGERRARGQFYTPPAVASRVTRWVLDGVGAGPGEDPPRVLDPAAGTGTFPLAVFDRLRQRNPAADPDSLLARLVAVDVDDVGLHLAALRLSARADGRPVSAFDRRACSFFDLAPGSASAGDGGGTVPPVDAVVGNPPFVRAGDLAPGRDHFRGHLDAFGANGGPADPGGDSPYADGEAALSRRSDAYVYFVTHATRFLRPGGRLGLVLPAKWLESDYGVGFRRFLADQYRVRAVVGFGARAFDALVDTVLLLAVRRDQPAPDAGSEREAAPAAADVRFVRVDEPLGDGSSLSDVLGDARRAAAPTGASSDAVAAPAATRNGSTRVVACPQSTFASSEKCSPYLRAPGALLPLLDHPGFVQLDDLARVSRGVTTGANRFFLLDGADRERWGIDPDLLRPAVRSIRGVESRTLRAADVDLAVVDVHRFLEGRTGDSPEADPTERGKRALRRAGHDALADYVEHAEAEGWHGGRTCQARRVWFDLGALPTPDAFVPKLLRERVFTVENRAGAVPTNAIDCVSVREGIDPDVLLGVLDSSLCRALMEVWGRNEAGMLQLMTYETRTLPVPDLRAFPADAAAEVRRASVGLGADGDGQAELDEAVHAAVDVDVPAGRARAIRESLLDRRVDGGDRVEFPVSGG